MDGRNPQIRIKILRYDPIELDTPLGRIRGCVLEDDANIKCKAFYGIPYAEPPVGNLRFKNPVPVRKWPEPFLDASEEKKGFLWMYIGLFQRSEKITEETYLDVFVPHTPEVPEKGFPVLVSLCGGAFQVNDVEHYYTNASFLENGIIYVKVYSRCGALGFFKLDDVSLNVTGNQGLKDQAMALRWVRENIQYFGGDRNNITITGLCAGAASAHWHSMSPMSKGLFDKAILWSGTGFSAFLPPNPVNKCKQMAKILGCKSDDDASILEFLQTQKAEDICEVQLKMSKLTFSSDIDYQGVYPFVPIIEDSSASEPFLTEDPEIFFQQNRVIPIPMMISFTKDDAIEFAYRVLSNLKLSNFKGNCYIPPKVAYFAEKNGHSITDIEKEVEDFYFNGNLNWKAVCSKKTTQFENFHKNVMDARFMRGIFKTAKYSKNYEAISGTEINPPVYICEVNYLTNFNKIVDNAAKDLMGKSLPFLHEDKFDSCFHTSDMFCVKFTKYLNIKEGSVEERSVQTIMSLWTNFIKYSNPNGNRESSLENRIKPSEWNPVRFRHGNVEFFSINNYQEAMMESPEYTARMEFWDNLYDRVLREKKDRDC